MRRATDADVPAMAAQLARTFDDDPVIRHLFRDDARRPAGLQRYFTTKLRRDYLAFGGCSLADADADGDDGDDGAGTAGARVAVAGSAIWAPAGKPQPGTLAGLVSMLAVLPYVATTLITTLRLLDMVESKHPRQPHWYLDTLGTAVDRQGQGVGTALLRPVLEHCDREGLPAYLESSKEQNLPFYRRHGFEVVDELTLPGRGPTMWTMLRPPKDPPPS